MSPPWRQKLKYSLKYILLPAQISACSIIFINDNVFEILAITGASMQPTLSPQYRVDRTRDFVLWDKFAPTEHLKRGDIVLFHAPHAPDKLSVKRVVALGEDTVLLDPRRRPEDVINGAANDAAKKWDVMFRRNLGRVEVPVGHVWVEGDNWRRSNDSNAYGPISKNLILGKARFLVWPLREFGGRPWEVWTTRRTKVVPARPKDVKEEGESWWQPV
ncbi:Mitochondrial inner membrane protease subunit [Cercospora zeina]